MIRRTSTESTIKRRPIRTHLRRLALKSARSVQWLRPKIRPVSSSVNMGTIPPTIEFCVELITAISIVSTLRGTYLLVSTSYCTTICTIKDGKR